MNAFRQASEIEQIGLELIRPFLLERAINGQVVYTDKGRLSRDLQKSVGDALFNCEAHHIWGVEFKVEQENRHGNFFIETWSNRHWRNQGWLYTLDTDILLYVFIDSTELYSIPFQRMRSWLLQTNGRSGEKVCDYPLKSQSKYEQLNDTWGRCVPITHVQREVGLRRYVRSNSQWQAADGSEPEGAGQTSLLFGGGA